MEIYLKIWLFVIILYGIDCLILTPYILYKNLGEEVGLLMSFGFNQIGLIWFPIWFFIFAFSSFLFIRWFDKIVDKKCKQYAFLPKVTLILVWLIGMGWVILNNLKFI